MAPEAGAGATVSDAAGAAGVAGASAGGAASAGFFLKKLNISGYLESHHSMKRALTLAALAACLVVPPAGAQTSQNNSVQQFTLKNGMQLIVKPDRRAPTAIQMVWVRVGAMDEVDGTSGVAHALEHMMFKGSKTVPPGQFSRRVAALGGQENAFTNRDYTGYYQQIPAAKLPDVMKLEADRFAHNQWPDAEFRKEIEVVKEERRMRTEDQPRALLMEQLFAASFVASPYHRPVVGWMGDLDAMAPDDVRQFHHQWYVPANAAVVVAGDVDAQQVRAWAEQTYGRIPARAVPVRKPRPEPEQRGLRRIDVKAPAEQAYVALAWHVPTLRHVTDMTADDRDALALLVLSAVLDGYSGARLDRALTQGEHRVADDADSGASVINRGPGLFLLTGVPAQGKTAEDVEQALRAEVARVARDGVAPAELERVKTQWTASNIYERDSLMNQAQELGSYWVLGLPTDAEERLIAELRQVTPEQVQAVAAKYFGDDTLTVATLRPQPRPAGQRPRPEAPTGGPLH